MKTIKDPSGLYRIRRLLISLLLVLFLSMQLVLPGAVVFAASAPETTTISSLCRGSDGKYYKITASYGQDAGIPADAVLSVSPISADDGAYAAYVAGAEQTLRCSIDRETGIRLFDISITDASDGDVRYQPADGAAVEMQVRLADAPETEFGVVHFGDETQRLDSEVVGRTLSFETTGFSVYAFVNIEAPDGLIRSADAFAEEPVYLFADITSNNADCRYYISSGIVYDSAAKSNVIRRTEKNSSVGAVAYGFEKLAGTENQYYMFLPGENGEKQYVKLTNNTNVEYVSAPATVITITPCGEKYPGRFNLAFDGTDGKTYYLNLRKDTNGKGFGGSDYGGSDGMPKFSRGSQIYASIFVDEGDDMIDLNGRTYALATKGDKNSALTVNTANALTVTPREDGNGLAAASLPVRTNPLDSTELTMIRTGGDADLFTFHSQGGSNYYITASVGGAMKYLSVTAGGAALLDAPDETCLLKVSVGTGNQRGKIRISNGAYALSLVNGTASGGFAGKNAFSDYEFFNLAEKTFLEDEDFVPYTAVKVSVSDKQRVYNGSQVVVYTRIWNESAKRYEFYAVDHDGSLVQVFDEGDTIRWAGTQINTLLWDFTEYYYWLTRIPNHYYELRNHYSRKYIAPQYHNGQVLSNGTIGINLNGRRYNDYSTTILAWDDARYDYASLQTEGNAVVAVPMARAQTFYFAVMDDPVAEEFSTVETVDNNDHNIRMRMINFRGTKYGTNNGAGGRDMSQTVVLGEVGDVDQAAKTPSVSGNGTVTYSANLKVPYRDLVTTDLGPDGYPVATHTGTSLAQLFGSATDVNHLFIKSIYDESGYFEYNCCQTFASLQEGGNFRVYNQLGTPETGTVSQGHGQFMPFNDIDPHLISDYTNMTNVYNQALAANDPRLGETLYKIPVIEAQYHFGMEMEASFIQSKSGLDAWGHDIIFEFAGDDDMWLYVDGELVLDLGGIHSALVGKINFRTGEVVIPDPGKTTGESTTVTLRSLFENNFRTRNPEATDAEVEAHLDRIFTPGTSVFRDYSSHTMKMYYMERGAGASNLHMRFNLTTAVDGQLLLGKTVSGTDKEDYAGAKFPFQIHYFDKDEQDVTVSRRTIADGGSEYLYYEGVTFVNYKGTQTPVEYMASYEGYENVFFLKPGEIAEIQFPDDGMEYYVTECRINTDIYDAVSVNDEPVAGVRNGSYYDFASQREVIGQRKVVNFDNHVSPNALRTLLITKRLFDVNNEPLHYADDPTGFRFRVFIGEDLDYYRFDKYYVRDPDNNYCCYDYDLQAFRSLGVTDFDLLTDAQKTVCTFTTSPSGAVDKIPADYSVEIRNLLIDTKFKVEEQKADIPKGYDLIGYERAEGSYISDGEPNFGIIRDRSDPHVIVNNHRGWGLTGEKVWTDDSFMTSHDNIYFAVYCRGELLEGTVRRLETEVTESHPAAETSLYYYFENLLEGAGFSDYAIREVELVNPVMEPDSDVVASYDAITPVGEGGVLHGGGVAAQTGEHGNYAYVASYQTGEPAGPARNVRTDRVTNARPGIRLVKVDANGAPLPGAVFTLTDGEGRDVTKESYISDDDGLITYAYPEDGVMYSLTEIAAPEGYSATVDTVTLTVTDGELTLDCADESAVAVSPADAAGMVTVSVKNYRSAFTAVKVDAGTGAPVADAHFALYRQVEGKDGPRKDYFPMTGYEDLVTDAQGVIPKIDMTLPEGAYYLCETRAPKQYRLRDKDILISVDENGSVSVLSEGDAALLTADVSAEQVLTYVLRIPNDPSFRSVTLTPQTLVADFGLDIDYPCKDNNYLVPANSEYTYVGITAQEHYNAYGTQEAPALLCGTGEAYAGLYGRVTLSEDGAAHYEIGSMTFPGEDTFCLVAHVTKIGGAAADVYAYEMLTYLPATTIYYEDDFVPDDRYHDGVEGTVTGHNFGKWSRVTAGDAQTNQAADLAGHSDANIFGYDPAYTACATFSNNSAHRVSVSAVNSDRGGVGGSWPYVEYDFAGTGFDLISVTAGDTGLFTVRVYKTETDAQGNVTTVGNPIKNLSVDTYYGYDYGRMYLGADGAATLTDTGIPLYDATQDLIDAGSAENLLTASGKFLTTEETYHDPSGGLTRTPYYCDEAGRVTDTVYYRHKTQNTVTATVPAGEQADYEPNFAYAYAEGWILNPDASEALYQIPVIKVRDLEYGSYRAHIEPRFTAQYRHYQTVDGYQYFDLYVDAFRIYDPAQAGADGSPASAVIREAYDYACESYEKFTTLKKVVLGADTMGLFTDDSKAEQEGVVIIDGSTVLNTARLNDYLQFGPNNELYLSKNMSMAFEICASEIPADVQIQIKKISAAIPKLKFTYVNGGGKVFTGEVEVRTSNDLSYSVLSLLGRNNFTWSKLPKANNAADTALTSGLLIISNVGEENSLVSVTNLKWTFRNTDGQLRIRDDGYKAAVSPKSVSSVQRVMRFAGQENTVAEDAAMPAVYRDGEIRMSVVTASSTDALVVRDGDGNLIDESRLEMTYADFGDAQRRWTVTLREDADGDYVFFVAAQQDDLESGQTAEIRVSVDNLPTDDPAQTGEDPDGVGFRSGFPGFLERLRSSFLRFSDLLKKLLSVFGVRWS